MGTSSRQRTKIVATLGPATDAPEAIEDLIHAGVDIVRLNLSHGVHADHERRLAAVRASSTATGIPIAVMADLQGPKIRLGVFGGNGVVDWPAGHRPIITVAPCDAGTVDRVGCTYDRLHQDLSPGDAILIDDGLLRLRVETIDGDDVHCLVEEGGRVSSHKGMNLPGVQVSAPTLSDSDFDDIAWALAVDVDLVALSFVRSADDIATLRSAFGNHEHPPGIIAKIERADAVTGIDAIIKAVDGIMVARGDLGTEIGHHRLPAVQKDLLRRASLAGRFSITATQMLESMVHNPIPTRAEACDVANAVYDGSDAVMLSAETAVGDHAVRAVRQMASICREAGTGEWRHLWPPDAQVCSLDRHDLAFTRAAVNLADALPAQAILIHLERETDTVLLSIIGKFRSSVPVFALCANERIRRRSATGWGIVAVPSVAEGDSVQPLQRLYAAGWARPGDRVIVLSGAGEFGPTHIELHTVEP